MKLTFLKYPYVVKFTKNYENIFVLPDVLTLAAMKAFALGRRAKWKDYVDLYFILKIHSLKELVIKAKAIFKNEFNEKLFREQLAYFDDIDYSEMIDYMEGFKTEDEHIKKELTNISLQKFE